MAHSDFDKDIEQLAKAHEKAETTMLSLILSFLTGKATYEQATQGISQIAQALASASAEWVQGVLPRIYADGVQTAQKALESDEDATVGSPNTQAHSASLRLFQEDLAADLAATTNRMNDDAKASLRDLARQQITEMMASGKNAIPQSREMAAEMEKRGVKFTDRSGRRWKPRDYSKMVLRTKAVEVSNQANVSAAREFGSKVMRIFDGGPGDVDQPCIDANGQVWTAEYFATHLLEHPQCRRAGSPLPSSYSGRVDRGEVAPEAGFDPLGDEVTDNGATLVVNRTDEPTDDDLRRLKQAYPAARTVEWNGERHGLRRFATPETKAAAEKAAEPEPTETGPARVSDTVKVGPLTKLGNRGSEIPEAVDSIDRVHRTDRDLPPIQLRVKKHPKGTPSHGYYATQPTNGEPNPVEIGINPESTHVSITTSHELGHYLDHTAFGQWDNFGSVVNPELEPLMEAIKSSDGYGGLVFARGNLGVRYEKTFDYLVKPEELFARAYSQYIATRSGNQDMLNNVDEERNNFIATQWWDSDFEPIAAEFDKLFEARGWRNG